MYKDFVLKNKDIDILKFRIEDSLYGDYELTILERYNINNFLYPVGLKTDDSNELLEWIQERNIPKNRAFVNEILASLGLHGNDLIGILTVGKGLSLNDPYWIVDPDFTGLFKDYNLYENDFNKSVALIAYTGHGHSNSICTVAELTTNGSLKKAWRRINGDVVLYKGNVHGNLYTNHGKEAYAEYYAYKVAHQMGLNAIVKNIPENKQSKMVKQLLMIYNPDILVITGHDGMIKNNVVNDIFNYRNSRHFIETIKQARKFEKVSKKKLVIFAGACQSYFEALISAGANFASSPARILIDFLDPLIVAKNVAETDNMKYVTIDDFASELRDGKNGVDGIGRYTIRIVFIR